MLSVSEQEKKNANGIQMDIGVICSQPLPSSTDMTSQARETGVCFLSPGVPAYLQNQCL